MAERKSGRALVLASGSRTRFEILKSAGLAFTVDPADIDEQALRKKCQAQTPPTHPGEIAQALAIAKAQAIGARHGNEIIIGSDQVLALDEHIFSKPHSRQEAVKSLLTLRGKTHALHTALAIVCNGNIHWQHVETAHLHMRDFSDEYANDYVRRVGDEALKSKGAYQIEGPGIQLFDKIEGDYFSILGLPILPLLKELRAMGELQP